jgi:CPA1 family monovalent cation:H+ antiporter
LVALVGGLLVGWLLSLVFVRIAKKHLDKNVIGSLNLLLPFVAYLIAEELHVSGVIATVMVGLHISQNKDKLPEQTVTQSKSVLDMAIFILGGLVFILIGLEFPSVLKNIPADEIYPLISCAFMIFGVALLIRMAIIFWHKQSMKNRLSVVKSRLKEPKIEASIHRREVQSLNGKIEMFESLLLHWKEAVIIGWSGMRGIVSLAAALSLPLLMADGSEFPQRDTILFLSVMVVIIMLVVQGLGLPILVKLLNIDTFSSKK